MITNRYVSKNTVLSPQILATTAFSLYFKTQIIPTIGEITAKPTETKASALYLYSKRCLTDHIEKASSKVKSKTMNTIRFMGRFIKFQKYLEKIIIQEPTT